MFLRTMSFVLLPFIKNVQKLSDKHETTCVSCDYQVHNANDRSCTCNKIRQSRMLFYCRSSKKTTYVFVYIYNFFETDTTMFFERAHANISFSEII